jgi:chorismate lyase
VLNCASADPPFRVNKTTTDWHQLTPIWVGSAKQLCELPESGRGSKEWRKLLAGHGSPTIHVRRVTGRRLSVDVIEMKMVDEASQMPSLVAQLPAPRVRRQVYGLAATGDRLFYAVSWWSEEAASRYLSRPDRPIWENLASIQKGLERRIDTLTLGNSLSLEAEFGQQGPFWGRLYGFWHRCELLAVVFEVFSPLLWNYPEQEG